VESKLRVAYGDPKLVAHAGGIALGGNLDGLSAPMLRCRQLFSGGAVAQLGARLDGIEEVVGSNPIGSTN
jgi:hypothetical protein